MNETFTDPVIRKDAAVNAAKNKKRLAEMLGINRQAITDWGEYVPATQAYRLAQIFPDIVEK
jgi:hypothetical protein